RRRHTRLVSDWSSDVCSSDLLFQVIVYGKANAITVSALDVSAINPPPVAVITTYCLPSLPTYVIGAECAPASIFVTHNSLPVLRSEEHTSELQSLTNLVCRLL